MPGHDDGKSMQMDSILAFMERGDFEHLASSCI